MKERAAARTVVKAAPAQQAAERRRAAGGGDDDEPEEDHAERPEKVSRCGSVLACHTSFPPPSNPLPSVTAPLSQEWKRNHEAAARMQQRGET